MAQSDDGATDEEGGAKSFDELREEYEDGAEWGEGETAGEPATGEEADGDEEPEDEPAAAEEDGLEEASGEEPDDVDEERVDALFEEDEATADEDTQPAASAQQAAPQPAAQPAGRRAPQGAPRQPVAEGAGEKPYLRELPGGYVADLLVMEWVEFLVTESSPRGAQRAITYYENVGWIGHRAADQLRAFVDGHPEATATDEEAESTTLSMDHHTTSLRYVARISGDVQENVLAAWDEGDNSWLHR